jgi:hypothetical protein
METKSIGELILTAIIVLLLQGVKVHGIVLPLLEYLKMNPSFT